MKGTIGITYIFSTALVIICSSAYGNHDRGFPMGCSAPEAIKQKIIKGDTTLNNELLCLIQEAELLLHMTPPSVTHDKTAPDDFDPHDYVSYAPYWWPNPTTDNGLPYVRRDGEINYEIRNKGDDMAFTLMANSFYLLSLTYFYTEEEKYAQKATELVSVWFLDSLTRMNPNVNGGQIILGKKDQGRRAGINEMRFLSNVVDGVELLTKSQSWTTKRDRDLKEWFSEYFTWLATSDHGKKERERPNNHGTWYDVQYVSIALFIGKANLARKEINNYSKTRIASQIDSVGMQPLEVTRGYSLHYSVYNIRAFFALATYAERLNIDLWKYTTKNEISIKMALDYVIPYIGNQEAWPHNDKGRDPKDFAPLLLQVHLNDSNEKYLDAYSLAESIDTRECQYYKLIITK